MTKKNALVVYKPKSNKTKVLVVAKRKKHRGGSSSLAKMFPGVIGGHPMPLNKLVKLKYSTTHNMAVGASGILGTQQKWNLNSIYDVDATGGGHQPSGFDQMAAFYNRYKVLGVDVTVRITDPTIDGMRVFFVIMNPANNAETLTGDTKDAVSEIQQSGYFDINNSGSQKIIKRFYAPIWKLSGLTKLQFDADPDNYTGPVTGDPGLLVQMACACCDLNQGSSGGVIVTVDLVYHVRYYQRKFLPQS